MVPAAMQWRPEKACDCYGHGHTHGFAAGGVGWKREIRARQAPGDALAAVPSQSLLAGLFQT
jgi:hypothetical protein